MSRRVALFLFICLFVLASLPLCSPCSYAFTTVVGGETISWNFEGIPSSNFFGGTDPCYYRSDTNYYVCDYGITDPPYVDPVTFTASITPSQGTYPAFHFGYYDVSDLNHYSYKAISSAGCVYPCLVPLNTSVSFYIPARAGSFTLIYSSNGQGTGATNIQMNFQVANYDPCRANLQGGDDINPDSDYCDESTQPGMPRMRKYHNKKGAGPGK
jgi:hypothetical protein